MAPRLLWCDCFCRVEKRQEECFVTWEKGREFEFWCPYVKPGPQRRVPYSTRVQTPPGTRRKTGNGPKIVTGDICVCFLPGFCSGRLLFVLWPGPCCTESMLFARGCPVDGDGLSAVPASGAHGARGPAPSPSIPAAAATLCALEVPLALGPACPSTEPFLSPLLPTACGVYPVPQKDVLRPRNL